MDVMEMDEGFFVRIPKFQENINWDDLYKWLHDAYGIGAGRYQIIQSNSGSYRIILFKDLEDIMAFKLRCV